jgi:hypothetical protein
MAGDKKTIGLTDASKAVMDEVVEKAGFKRDMDAGKFAFALAVNRGCEPAQVEGAGTIWNVGSFDEGGDLKALIQNLFPKCRNSISGARIAYEYGVWPAGCGAQGQSGAPDRGFAHEGDGNTLGTS